MTNSGEDVMARARAYVVERHAAEQARQREGFRALVVDDEFAQMVYDLLTKRRGNRQASDVLAGLAGSGKASAWWGMTAMRMDGELLRIRSGFVPDDEMADRPIPVTWTPPLAPPRSLAWLWFWYPWASLRGRWDGWRARRRLG